MLTPAAGYCLNSLVGGPHGLAALAGHSTLETLAVVNRVTGENLVVFEQTGGSPRVELLSSGFEFCSLTIEFEGRETQTAGSWRTFGRKTDRQTDSGELCVPNTITVMFALGN